MGARTYSFWNKHVGKLYRTVKQSRCDILGKLYLVTMWRKLKQEVRHHKQEINVCDVLGFSVLLCIQKFTGQTLQDGGNGTTLLVSHSGEFHIRTEHTHYAICFPFFSFSFRLPLQCYSCHAAAHLFISYLSLSGWIVHVANLITT